MFRLNDLLRGNNVPPERTAVLLHTPGEARLARLLPFLAQEEPEILEAFQSVHSSRATATLRKRDFMVSFVRIEGGSLAMAGVFRNQGCIDRPTQELAALPAMRRVINDFGANADLETSGAATWPWFDFVRISALEHYKGRIQIRPRLTQSYARLAENLDAEIVALTEASVLVPSAPGWRDFVVTTAELRSLPANWSARLREWRGVYLIVDESDGVRYVGSAYGEENFLGRWRTHVGGEAGITAKLKRRRVRDFRFSILERVSPDMQAEDVIRRERTWMDRLHTIQYGLNS